ncbi:P-loop containing nucleoside triphosphate hydrolase protein [Serendipita vermifera]|nr:P-loop containing nucleoside triphosphate hydrolase protein [Serendipita vermifera]
MFRTRKKILSSTSISSPIGSTSQGVQLGDIWRKGYAYFRDAAGRTKFHTVVTGAGKTSLVVRFIESTWFEGYDYTIEESYRKKCNLDGEDVILDVLDAWYGAEYPSMVQQFVRACEGLLFAYSINDRESFEGMKAWSNTLLRLTGDPPPVMVVGTKCDQELDREVTMQEAHEFATKLHGLYIETSAKLDVNVESAFMNLVNLIRRRNDVRFVSLTC